MEFPLFNIIKEAITPATELVDNLHTSTEEKLTLKAHILNIQSALINSALNYEAEIAKQQSENIRAEAKGESWIQRSWRPVLMLTFGVLICYVILWGGYDLQGRVIPSAYIEYVLEIVQWAVSGYVVGRSAEKVSTKVVKALKAKEEV